MSSDEIVKLQVKITNLQNFITQLSIAPDSQVSAFVRAACAAFLAGSGIDIPPGDPLKSTSKMEISLSSWDKIWYLVEATKSDGPMADQAVHKALLEVVLRK